MKKITYICLFLVSFFSSYGQSRGSVPEVLLRPARGEASYYPVDIVIGELGQGRAPYDAFIYANSVAAGLLSRQISHPALASFNPALCENYIRSLENISVHGFRLGGGKQVPDGDVSFLVRFIGIDYGITGELYVRSSTGRIREDGTGEAVWIFDELLFEEAKSHSAVAREVMNRLDKLPYERFY